MDDDEIKLHEEAYSRAVALFDEVAHEVPGGLSREVFLKLVMQAAACRWTMLPMSRAERDNYIKAVIITLIDLAPANALEGILAAQILTNHEVIVACHSRVLNQNELSIHRDASQKHAIKAMETSMKQMITYQSLIDRRQFNMKSAKTPDRERAARLSHTETNDPNVRDRSASSVLSANRGTSKK